MPLSNPNLFLISGGPGSGKTTVLRELAKAGFSYVPEVARRIIQEQVETGGTALPWADRTTYTRLMLQRSIETFLEHLSTAMPTFADRGIPDTLGYARLIDLQDEFLVCEIESACREHPYAPVVFLAPPWREIYETDSERKQDFAEAERTFEQVLGVYERCEYETAILPKVSARERASFMLERIQQESKTAK